MSLIFNSVLNGATNHNYRREGGSYFRIAEARSIQKRGVTFFLFLPH